LCVPIVAFNVIVNSTIYSFYGISLYYIGLRFFNVSGSATVIELASCCLSDRNNSGQIVILDSFGSCDEDEVERRIDCVSNALGIIEFVDFIDSSLGYLGFFLSPIPGYHRKTEIPYILASSTFEHFLRTTNIPNDTIIDLFPSDNHNWQYFFQVEFVIVAILLSVWSFVNVIIGVYFLVGFVKDRGGCNVNHLGQWAFLLQIISNLTRMVWLCTVFRGLYRSLGFRMLETFFLMADVISEMITLVFWMNADQSAKPISWSKWRLLIVILIFVGINLSLAVFGAYFDISLLFIAATGLCVSCAATVLGTSQLRSLRRVLDQSPKALRLQSMTHWMIGRSICAILTVVFLLPSLSFFFPISPTGVMLAFVGSCSWLCLGSNCQFMIFRNAKI